MLFPSPDSDPLGAHQSAVQQQAMIMINCAFLNNNLISWRFSSVSSAVIFSAVASVFFLCSAHSRSQRALAMSIWVSKNNWADGTRCYCCIRGIPATACCEICIASSAESKNSTPRALRLVISVYLCMHAKHSAVCVRSLMDKINGTCSLTVIYITFI